jgi:hypothetical protein
MTTPIQLSGVPRRIQPAGKLKTLGLVLLTAAALPVAKGGCGDISGFYGPYDFPAPAAYAQAAQKEAATAGDNRGAASIVGMWKFQVVSTGNTSHNPPIPDGASIDSGYSQWHSDGNEFSTSAPHSPASGNICLGVWTNTAPRAFELNHFALNFDPTSGAWTGTVNIHQDVTISPGGTMYIGSYIIDVYDTKGTHLDHIVGQVTATRITLDSGVN